MEKSKPSTADMDIHQLLKNTQELRERDQWKEKPKWPHRPMLRSVVQPMHAVAYSANSLGLDNQ